MKRLNRSQLLGDSPENMDNDSQNKSFSEGSKMSNMSSAKYVAPESSPHGTDRYSCKRLITDMKPTDGNNEHSGNSERKNLHVRSDSNVALPSVVYDDDSFIREKMVSIKLKRIPTPSCNLPERADEEDKIDEIGDKVEMNPLEILERQKNDISCYSLVYFVSAFRLHIQSFCLKVVQHPFFEAVSLLTILVNCIILSLDDPTNPTQEQWQTNADYTFQGIYTAEIVIKVFGMGFALNKGAYIRDPWNVLDFVIVVFGYLSYLNISGGVDLKALRTFRVLRPLRTISSVEGLKILMSALVTSLPLLFDTIVILMFFFIIFAIAGLQLWHGNLTQRCMNIETGDVNSNKVCGSYGCDAGFTCVETHANPNYGSTHFDDIFTALLTVFQCITMEGWTDTQLLSIRAFGPYAVIFYTPLVVIGSFFLINFTLAVIKSRVSKLYEENRKLKLKGRVMQEEARSLQSEKKISIADILRRNKAASGDTKIASKMRLFAQRLKNRKHLSKILDLKSLYAKALGFFDPEEEDMYMRIPNEDAELDGRKATDPSSPINLEKCAAPAAQPTLSSSGSNQDLKKKAQMQQIHEDVIREVDESPMSVSSITENVPWTSKTGEISNKVATNIKKSLGVLAGVRKGHFGTSASNPVRLDATAKQIDLQNKNKKITMSGMLGMKPRVTPEIRAAFGAPTVVEDLDEFTEEFFGQEAPASKNPSSLNVTDRDKSRKKALPAFPELSSSILDLEESRFQATPKEATATFGSGTNPRENASLTPRDPPTAALEEEGPHPSQTFQDEFQRARDQPAGNANLLPAGHTQPQPALKEQNTTGTAASTSLSTSILDNATNKVPQLLGKLHKLRLPTPNKAQPDQKPLPQPDALPSSDTTSPPGKPLLNVPATDLESPHHEPSAAPTEDVKAVENEEKEITEKLVLTDKGIIITSAADVLLYKPPAEGTVSRTMIVSAPMRAPYKTRVNYVPTELPEEDDDDLPGMVSVHNKVIDANTVSETNRLGTGSRRDDASCAGDLGGSCSVPSIKTAGNQPTTKVRRRRSRSKGKKKAKGKKKGSGDTESRSSDHSKTKKPAGGNKGTPSQMAPSSAVPSNRYGEGGSIAESGISTKKKGEDDADNEEERKSNLGVQEQINMDKKTEGEGSTKPELKWSGQEVLTGCDPYAAVYMTSYMSAARVWAHGSKGMFTYIRSMTRAVFTSGLMENFMNLLVMVNTIMLALDRYGQPDDEDTAMNTLNIVFTAIFTFELAAKLFGMGLVKYVNDPFNCLDGAVVIFSLIEIIFLNGQGALSAFRSLRILRTVRVLRVSRLLRSLRSMQMIIDVIGATIGSFAYIGILLMIFSFIYALFGMQFFGGAFNFSDGKPRQNFDSFNNAFMTIYQVMTMENWQNVLYSCMRAQTPVIAAIYLITWIFIGNYILLNLFLAIMLDAFSSVDAEMEQEADSDEVGSSEYYAVETSERTKTITSLTAGGSMKTGSIKTKSKFGVGQSEAKQRTIAEDFANLEDLTQPQKAEAVPYKDVDCMYSLYLFSKENPIRLFCWDIITSEYFESVILTIICSGSIKLAVDTYFLREANDLETTIGTYFDLFFTACFTLECVIKVISMGFVVDTGSYLRDSWNVLDFCIVVASLIDSAVTEIDIPMIKVLRLFRTFRPLRFITHNVNMRIIVSALFKSLGAILNTLIVVLMIWMMFSIVGVNFFAGKFQYCTVDTYTNSNKGKCLENGGQWQTYDHNFDNSINGLIFLFVLTTQENWPSLVYQAIDCTDVEQGPVMDNSWYYGYYFVVFLFIGSLFLLNLFVGVMFLNFTKVQKHASSSFGDILISEDQLNWIEVQKMIARAEPNYNARTVPSQSNWRKPFHALVTCFEFEIFIAIIILLNMVQMAMLYEAASDTYLLVLDIINYTFTGIFTIETILKLIGFADSFWYDPWNVFDVVIVLCSYVDIVFSSMASTSLKMLRIGPQLLRVLRVLRVSRLLRLVKKYKRLQDIMEIIQLCLPSMMNVFALLTLILFIYAILGCYLFYDVSSGDSVNDFYNFYNFGYAMILCLKMATGEDWNKFMFDCARTSTSCAAGLGCGKLTAFIYFLTFKFIVTFIMLNLFILIVLQLFEKYFIETDNIVSKFKEDFELFQNTWQSLGPTHGGFMMSQDKLLRFFSRLRGQIGMEGMDINLMSKAIIEMAIRSDDEKNIFFNELLFCTMRRHYSSLFHSNAFIIRKERETRHKIHSLAERAAKRGRYQTARKVFIKTATPFVSLMLLRVTLKLWRKYDLQHKNRVEENAKQGHLNYESSADEEEFVRNHQETPTHKRQEVLQAAGASVTAAVEDFISGVTATRIMRPLPRKSSGSSKRQSEVKLEEAQAVAPPVSK